MSCCQKKIDEIVKFIKKADELRKEANYLKVFGYDHRDKESYMLISDFIKVFYNYKIERRDSEDDPYQAIVQIGDYKVCALLSEEEYAELRSEEFAEAR